MRALYRWRYFPAVVLVAVIGAYLVAQQIFGPYRQWTLWVRGPIATTVTAAFLWAYVGRHLWGARRDIWAARKRTGWW
jgi:hypothetical protein